MSRIQDFWNNQASKGDLAGTQDIIAKKLEMKAIAKYVQDGQHIMDMGCGNGITALYLAKYFDVDILAVDFSPKMIEAANGLKNEQSLKGYVDFQVLDVRDFSEKIPSTFDLIYTERTLVNLETWADQKKAIENITGHLGTNGQYVMRENSADGLIEINKWRAKLGLHEIKSPWHNRYMRDEEIAQITIPGVKLEKMVFYSSTYYFLSRIVNAWIAKMGERDPNYHSIINKAALVLPAIGRFGQGRIWLWKKG